MKSEKYKWQYPGNGGYYNEVKPSWDTKRRDPKRRDEEQTVTNKHHIWNHQPTNKEERTEPFFLWKKKYGKCPKISNTLFHSFFG